MFWSTETLKRRLGSEAIVSHYDPERVEDANYRLRLGDEAYVSPIAKHFYDRREVSDLRRQGMIEIPPGQFGFLITMEQLCIPKSSIAFISMRTKLKFRGLVNVSGFHIGPGYTGKIVFAVFNAGPSPVALRMGDECFQLWMADLDSTDPGRGKIGYNKIESEIIQGLGSNVVSLSALNAKVDGYAKAAGFLVLLLVPLVVGLSILLLRQFFE